MPTEQLATPVEVEAYQPHIDQPVDLGAADHTAEVKQMPLTRVQIPVHEGQSDVTLAYQYAQEHPGWHSAGILEGDGERFIIFERPPDPASTLDARVPKL